jgi:hypothetical protein
MTEEGLGRISEQEEGHEQQAHVDTNCLHTMNGIRDSVVITVGIKVESYKQYFLDNQIDTCSIISYAKAGATPSYSWQPIEIRFKTINTKIVPIHSYAPNFPTLINVLTTSVIVKL